MIVKWHGEESSMRKLNEGGPLGGLWGILEYLSQSNGHTNFISNEKKFKFIDDLSLLEIVNILSIGYASYNFKMHVASAIPTNGYYIPNVNLEIQSHLTKINQWTKDNKMVLHKKKSNDIQFHKKNPVQQQNQN